MTGTLLSLGHGYSAQALACRLSAEGWRIIGTTRKAARMAGLAAGGIEPVLWPGTPLAPLIAQATHILTSIAPDDAGDPVLLAEGGALAAAPAVWVGYLSTTSVYGDHGGEWVDENTPLAPTTRRGIARVQAEREWRALPLPLHIFRLAGIYGPGRGPFEKVLDGTARRIVKPGQVFSRIHVDDIAQAVHASMRNPTPGAVWNICDDDPAPPEDVIGYAARLMGLPEPPTEPWDTAEMTPMARSFYAESKRVRNSLMKRDLGIRLIHPDFRSGLAALLEQEAWLD